MPVAVYKQAHWAQSIEVTPWKNSKGEGMEKYSCKLHMRFQEYFF